MVRANDATGLAVITQHPADHVVFTIPADSIPQVLHRAAARAAVCRWKPRTATQDHGWRPGTLAAIDNQVDPTTGTVRLKALFANEDACPVPQPVRQRAAAGGHAQGDIVIVPTAAVQRSPHGTFVYVVKADGTVELRPVEVAGHRGRRDGDRNGPGGRRGRRHRRRRQAAARSKVSLPKAEELLPARASAMGSKPETARPPQPKERA